MVNKKLGLIFLRFVSIPFLIFQKRKKQKNGIGLFKIYKYIFFNISKGDKQKIGPPFLRFVSILFLIFEKGDQQKICPRFV